MISGLYSTPFLWPQAASMLQHPQYMASGLAPTAFYGLQQQMYGTYGNTGFENLASAASITDGGVEVTSNHNIAQMSNTGTIPKSISSDKAVVMKEEASDGGHLTSNLTKTNPFWPPSSGASSLLLSTLAKPTASDPSNDIINKAAIKKNDDFKIDMLPRPIKCV